MTTFIIKFFNSSKIIRFIIIFILIIIFTFGFMMMWVAYDRQQKYPQYGDGLFPKNEEQRRQESEPQVYVGR